MTIFDRSQEDQRAFSIPASDSAFEAFLPAAADQRKSEIPLPEVSEIDLMRHFSLLARKNVGIDTHFYPLGSCTMKLNPRINEVIASLPGFSRCHPLAPQSSVQGCLELIDELGKLLCEICGMHAACLAPCAGSQGEFVGIRVMSAYLESIGEGKRDTILIPDSAHGTNPATAALCGYKVLTLKTKADGDIDLDDLRTHATSSVAGLMLTNPNTLGLFSPHIEEIARIIHDCGGLVYYDGANLNPLLCVCRIGDMGFDVCHLNLHKTFSTPHGGGGPGSGPVLTNQKLAPFLPSPHVKHKNGIYTMTKGSSQSIGTIASFYGNFGIYLRAYAYIRMHGFFGLRKIAEGACVNANYLKAKIAPLLKVPFARHCSHEFVISADRFLPNVRALDIAKRLLDYGFHAPTVYFPLIIKECLLIEPTESESKATLDAFVRALEEICKEAEQKEDLVQHAPHSLSVKRLDDVYAAKNPVLITKARQIL